MAGCCKEMKRKRQKKKKKWFPSFPKFHSQYFFNFFFTFNFNHLFPIAIVEVKFLNFYGQFSSIFKPHSLKKIRKKFQQTYSSQVLKISFALILFYFYSCNSGEKIVGVLRSKTCKFYLIIDDFVGFWIKVWI